MADPFAGIAATPVEPGSAQPGLTNEELYNASVPADAAFTRALDSGQLSGEAGDVLRDKLDAELSGDPRKAGALGRRAESLLRSAGAISPRIQRTGQIHSLGQAGEYALGQLGTMAGQVPPFLAAGVGARLLAPLALAKYAPAAGSVLRRALTAGAVGAAETGVGYPMMAGAARTAQFTDPQIEALPPEQRQAAMQKYALGTAAMGAVAPTALLHFPMKALARYPLASFAAGSLGQGAIMAGQEAATQQMLGGLNPQRDTSQDPEALKEAFIGGTVGAGAMVAPGLALRLAMHPAVTAIDHSATPDFSKGIHLEGHPVAVAAKQFLLGPKDPDLKGLLVDDTIGNIEQRLREAPETGAGLVAHVNNHPGEYSPETHEAARAHDQAATAQGIVLDAQLHETRSWFKTLADMFRKDAETPKKGEMLSAGTDEKTSEILQILADHLNLDAVRARSGRGIDEVIKRDLPAMAQGLAMMLAKGTEVDTSDIPALVRLRDAGDYFENPEQMLKKVAASLGLGDMNPAEFLGKGDPVRDLDNPRSMFSLYYTGPEAAKLEVAKWLRKYVDDPSLPANKLETLGKFFGGEDTARVVMEHYGKQQKDTILARVSEKEAAEQELGEGPSNVEHLFREGSDQMPFPPGEVGSREIEKNKEAFLKANPVAKPDYREIPYSEWIKEHQPGDPKTMLSLKQAYNKLRNKTNELLATAGEGDNKKRLAQLAAEFEHVDAIVNPEDQREAMDNLLSKYRVLERHGYEGGDRGAASDAELAGYSKKPKDKDRAPRLTFNIGKQSRTVYAEEMWRHEMKVDPRAYKDMDRKEQIRAAFLTAAAKLLARLPKEEAAKLKLGPDFLIDRGAGVKLGDAGFNYLREKPEWDIERGVTHSEVSGTYSGADADREREVTGMPEHKDDPLQGQRRDWAPELGPRKMPENVAAETIAKAKSENWKDIPPTHLELAWRHASEEDRRILEEQIAWHAQEQQMRDMQEREALKQELFSQGEAPSGEKISPEMRKKVRAELDRLIKDYELKFKDTHDWTGKWTHRMLRKGKDGLRDLIQISLYAGDPLGAARHEAFHKWFENLGSSPEEQQVIKDFYDIADDGTVIARLIAQYSKTPAEAKKNKAILDQIKGTTDRARRERMAYAYQLWAMDRDMGTNHLNTDAMGTIGQKIKDVFRKLADFFAGMFGLVSSYGRHEALLSAFHEGKFREAQGVKDFAQNRLLDTLQFRARRLAPDIYRRVANALTTATDELRNSRIRPFFDIANLFDAGAEHEEDTLVTIREIREGERTAGNGRPETIGNMSYIQARIRADNVLKDRFVKAIGKATPSDLSAALENLQRRRPPSNELERKLTGFLDVVHDYAERAGVARREQDVINGKPVVDENGQPVYVWKSIPYLKKYFPQVWDRVKITADPAGFINALSKYFPRDDVQALVSHVMKGDGMEAIADDPNHVGYTPAAAHIKNRGFLTDDPKALDEMARWQKKDMMEVMTTYLRQISHRAEYARYFGNDGEVLNKKFAEAAAAKADPKELERARHVVRALTGALRQDMNPELRDIFGTMATYQQVVLLPLTLLSSFVDANNIGVRTGSLQESFNAMGQGFRDLIGRIGGKTPADDMTELARTMGIIEHSSMIDRLGNVAGSMYTNERLRRFNNAFFRLNGMESWNQSMRTAALGAGMRFMVRHSTNPNDHSERYLRELGIQKGDIKELKDGRIATTEEDGLTKAQAMRVRDGLFKFVDSAVLRPSAAQRPAWGSDPMYQLIFHFKGFNFSFHKTILDRVYETERMNMNLAPMMLLAGHVPIMMAADFVRGGITGSAQHMNMLEYLHREVTRAGLVGIGQFGDDAIADMHRHMFPGTSFAGPTIQHAVAVGQAFAGDPRESWGKVLVRSLPMSPVVRGLT